MKVKLKLLIKGFLFVGPISLTPATPEIYVSLLDKSDQVILSIATSILQGRIESDFSAKEIVNMIKDDGFKQKALDRLFPQTEEPKKVIKTKPVPVKKESEQKVTDPVVIESTETPLEAPVDEVKEEVDPLYVFLVPGVKKAVTGLRAANLTKEEYQHVLELEKAGKNRSPVIGVLEEVIEAM